MSKVNGGFETSGAVTTPHALNGQRGQGRDKGELYGNE